jgi:hypothetical protein
VKIATNREGIALSKVAMKKNLELSQEVYDEFQVLTEYELDARDAYMRLLRERGWTLQSIADAVGDISRERVRQCIEAISIFDAMTLASDLKKKDKRLTFFLPEVPLLPEKVRSERVIVDPTPETLARLKELQPLANQVRYSHKAYRDEAEEYVALLWRAHTVEGASVYRIAQLLGVNPSGIQSRFVRYGYKTTEGSSASFTPIKYRKAR